MDEILAVDAYRVMVRQYLENRLAALPADGEAHDRGLLDILDDLARRGHPDPEDALATVMDVPDEVLKERLRSARQRLRPDGV